MAELGYYLPLGEIPQNAAPEIPEIIPENWTPLKKAVETYTRVALHCTRLWIHTSEERRLDHWEASKYDTSNPLDRTKIMLKSPLEPGLQESEIQNVIESTRRFFGVDPPEEWLDLLRITNGIWAAGYYKFGDISRLQMAPFSKWESVQDKMEWSMTRRDQPSNQERPPVELQQVYEFTSELRSSNFTPICGFRCGLIGNEYAPELAMYYLYGEYTGTEDGTPPEKVGKRWELVGTMFRKSGYEYFPNIPAALEFWASSYLDWGDVL